MGLSKAAGVARLSAFGAAAALLAGCTDSTPAPGAPVGGMSIAQYLEQAQLRGADAQQIEVLERARDRGEVTFEDLNEVAQLTMQCLTDAGFTIIKEEPKEYGFDTGLYMPYYLSVQPDGMSDKLAGEVIDDCSNRYDNWVGSAFADQPVVVEALNAPWDTPEVRECLKERGYQVEDDMTGTELNNLSMEDWDAHASDPNYQTCDPIG